MLGQVSVLPSQVGRGLPPRHSLIVVPLLPSYTSGKVDLPPVTSLWILIWHTFLKLLFFRYVVLSLFGFSVDTTKKNFLCFFSEKKLLLHFVIRTQFKIKYIYWFQNENKIKPIKQYLTIQRIILVYKIITVIKYLLKNFRIQGSKNSKNPVVFHFMRT